MGHEVGVYPVDEAGVHVCDLKQGGDLGVSGAAIYPDHVSYAPGTFRAFDMSVLAALHAEWMAPMMGIA